VFFHTFRRSAPLFCCPNRCQVGWCDPDSADILLGWHSAGLGTDLGPLGGGAALRPQWCLGKINYLDIGQDFRAPNEVRVCYMLLVFRYYSKSSKIVETMVLGYPHFRKPSYVRSVYIPLLGTQVWLLPLFIGGGRVETYSGKFLRWLGFSFASLASSTWLYSNPKMNRTIGNLEIWRTYTLW